MSETLTINAISETSTKTAKHGVNVGDYVNYHMDNGKDRACQVTHVFNDSDDLRLLFFSSPIPHAPNDEPKKGHWHKMKKDSK